MNIQSINQLHILLTAILLIVLMLGHVEPVQALCASPSASEGSMNYDATSKHRFEYCDNTDTWQELGVGTLESLGDVSSIMSPANGQIFTYNTAASEWDTQDVPSVSFPSGYIGMFDLTSCPSGWTLVTASQGYFPRGIDVAGTTDPDGVRAALNQQADTLGPHTHTADPPSTSSGNDGEHNHITYGSLLTDLTGNSTGNRLNALSGNGGGNNTGTTDSQAAHTHNFDVDAFTTGSTGVTESRPKNFAVLFCSKD